MNALQRSTALILLAGLIGLTGCGATHYGRDTIRGLDALVPVPADSAAAPAVVHLDRITPDNPRPLYEIGPGDVLTVVVWGRPDLGSTVPANSNNRRQVSTVNAKGDIELPFVGPLAVSGMSLRGVAVAVENAYESLVGSPQVEVEIVDYLAHPVLMGGQVQKPGTVFLTNSLQTIGEALAASDGPRNDGDLTRVLLTRDGHSYPLDLWAAEHGHNPNLDILMQAGDKIFVPPINENLYFILGDVPEPGPYPMPSKGATLIEGLANAGGIKMDSASFDDLLLFRKTATDSTVYKFTYFEAVENGDIPLQPGDRIHVSQSNVTKFGYVLKNLLPVLSVVTSVWIMDQIINRTWN
ncbi:hypothetical protein COW53_08080 [bacterium CG17_big_fil_post_rev_8_21_14_2_50_64_8]|nr:MAG: hypothetical protein COW53_08080 [bacterium CG17_big_fil_post_rev_8_21_14_2_50_64_8]PJA73641.1 MAG: hypothetical protein CO151_12775 [bacterium CG_4_9_14_3_um_filter_65_15]